MYGTLWDKLKTSVEITVELGTMGLIAAFWCVLMYLLSNGGEGLSLLGCAESLIVTIICLAALFFTFNHCLGVDFVYRSFGEKVKRYLWMATCVVAMLIVICIGGGLVMLELMSSLEWYVSWPLVIATVAVFTVIIFFVMSVSGVDD